MTEKRGYLLTVSLALSLLLHGLVAWYVLKGPRAQAIKGQIYRPSSTIYVTLEPTRGKGHWAKRPSRTKSYIIKSRLKHKRKRNPVRSKTSKSSRIAGSVAGKSAKGAVPRSPFLLVNPALKLYYDIIWERVKKNWEIPEYLKGKGLKTIVSLRIGKDGTVEDMYIERGSGNRFFDELAMKAIKASSPFPPIPEAAGKKSIEIGIIFKE